MDIDGRRNLLSSRIKEGQDRWNALMGDGRVKEAMDLGLKLDGIRYELAEVINEMEAVEKRIPVNRGLRNVDL